MTPKVITITLAFVVGTFVGTSSVYAVGGSGKYGGGKYGGGKYNHRHRTVRRHHGGGKYGGYGAYRHRRVRRHSGGKYGGGAIGW